MKGKPLTILLVEDNPDHAELILRSFRDNCVANKIHHVKDGAEALDYLFRRAAYSDPEQSPVPSLILLDLRLPKVDGIEVIRQIKTCDELKPIPLIVLTSSEAESDMTRAYANHANSYVVKPFDFNKFTGLMRDMGFYWLAWNRQPGAEPSAPADGDPHA